MFNCSEKGSVFQFFLSINPVHCHLQSYPNISTLFASILKFFSIGILFSFNFIIFMLFMYSIREAFQSIYSCITTGAIALIISEALLFIAYFWGLFTFTWSGSYDNVIFPSSRSLVLSITFILATASVMLGYVYCIKTYIISDSYTLPLILAIVLGCMFGLVQITEFNLLSLYMNNSVFGSCIFMLTGLHFSHVLVGVILLLIHTFSNSSNYISTVSPYLYNQSTTVLINQTEWFVLLYWHFVEIVWIFIQFVIYSE